jgi:hypothetical protein
MIAPAAPCRRVDWMTGESHVQTQRRLAGSLEFIAAE